MKILRVLFGVAVTLAVLAGGAYTAYWFITANSLQKGLEKWAADRRAQGYDIVWATASVSGFPTAFRIALTDASLARGSPATYRLATPDITGEAAPWDLSRWHVSAPSGASGNAQGLDATIEAQSVSGDIVLGAETNLIDLSALRVAGAGVEAGTIAAHVTLPRHPPQSHRDLGLAAMVQVYHLVLPRAVKALGNTIESVAVEFHVMGGLPPGDWRQSLAAWRDDGGTVELDASSLQWGALALELSGTLALDVDMQPTAALTGSVVNQDALIDAAAAAGVLPKKNTMLVKLVLDLLAKRGPDGLSRLTAPVTVQDGKLAIDKAEIGKVPRIEWK